uniref:Transcriptional regulator n=2 Tax=Caenorhabditis tropicalis TaxID=1561998 RepID=A0A1I7TJ67_9PELO
MEVSGEGTQPKTSLGITSSLFQKQATSSKNEVDSQPTFTMMDVFQELEELKDQSKPKGQKRSEDLLSTHVSSMNPWSYFNKTVSFKLHNQKMKTLSDEEVLQLARDEIGKRIAYHKERCENNEKRMHVHFRHKLHELKSKIDRSKAIVLIHVLQTQSMDEIEALERKLFPFTTRVLLAMD